MNIRLEDIQEQIEENVRAALKEDVGTGDITAQLIPEDENKTATIITREDCVLCGQAWLEETYTQLGGIEHIQWHAQDGDFVTANSPLVTLKGNARTLLTGERTALNFIQLLSATATKAKQYAQALGDSNIKLLDTRKTIPGLRHAQKYAVAVGGCHNHRIGLFDAFLIKENHIAACGSISKAVAKARALAPDKLVEVEVENLIELQEALDSKADVIMLDNFDNNQLRKLTSIDKGNSAFELSGNLSIDNVSPLIDSNIDYISFGALTKHVKATDLSFRITTKK